MTCQRHSDWGSDSNPLSKSSVPDQLTDFSGRLLFAANHGVNGKELWISDDGTEATTRMLKDIDPGEAGSGPDDLTVVSIYSFLRPTMEAMVVSCGEPMERQLELSLSKIFCRLIATRDLSF